MILVAHRRNSIEELKATPKTLGVEVDIRSKGEQLIIHHDPFADGEDFESWLAHFDHRLLILNVKEEGLEKRLAGLMADRGVRDFFFLDQSFPFLVKTAKSGERRCAVRISEFESIETALSLSGMIEWAWIDCFTRFPLTTADANRLRSAGLKLCLVSPELQGRETETEITAMKRLLEKEKISAEAVCTKRPDLWETA